MNRKIARARLERLEEAMKHRLGREDARAQLAETLGLAPDDLPRASDSLADRRRWDAVLQQLAEVLGTAADAAEAIEARGGFSGLSDDELERIGDGQHPLDALTSPQHPTPTRYGGR